MPGLSIAGSNVESERTGDQALSQDVGLAFDVSRTSTQNLPVSGEEILVGRYVERGAGRDHSIESGRMWRRKSGDRNDADCATTKERRR